MSRFNPALQKQPNVFSINTDIGLRRWKAALAKLKAGATGIINVSGIGDSITEGAWAGGGAVSPGNTNSWQMKGYLGRLRSAIMAKYGDTGLGFAPTFFPNNTTAIWTFNAGWPDNSGFFGITGLGKTCSTAGSTCTFSFNGTGFGIVVGRGSGAGTLTYSVDAGAATTINTNNATTINAYAYEVTGLADGAHTVTITATLTSGGSIFLLGAYPIRGTAGVRVNMCGRYGTKVGDSTSDKSLSCAIDMWSPALTIIALGANDYTGLTDLTSFRNSYQTIITRALSYGDVILVSTGLRSDGNSNPIPQSQYVDVMRQLALQNNVAFLDIFNRWKGDANYANTTLGFFADAVHPNDYGHQDIATAILNVLLEPAA